MSEENFDLESKVQFPNYNPESTGKLPCVLPLSDGPNYHYGERLEALAMAVKKRFSTWCVVPAGTLDRFNQRLKGKVGVNDTDEAERSSEKRGREYERENAKALKILDVEFKTETKATTEGESAESIEVAQESNHFKRWTSWRNHPKFKEKYDIVVKEYENKMGEFHRSVEEAVESVSVVKKKEITKEITPDLKRDLLRQYILEEEAMFYLWDEILGKEFGGKFVFVYPHENSGVARALRDAFLLLPGMRDANKRNIIFVDAVFPKEAKHQPNAQKREAKTRTSPTHSQTDLFHHNGSSNIEVTERNRSNSHSNAPNPKGKEGSTSTSNTNAVISLPVPVPNGNGLSTSDPSSISKPPQKRSKGTEEESRKKRNTGSSFTATSAPNLPVTNVIKEGFLNYKSETKNFDDNQNLDMSDSGSGNNSYDDDSSIAMHDSPPSQKKLSPPSSPTKQNSDASAAEEKKSDDKKYAPKPPQYYFAEVVLDKVSRNEVVNLDAVETIFTFFNNRRTERLVKNPSQQKGPDQAGTISIAQQSQ